VWIARVDASLYFANMAGLERAMQNTVADRPDLRAIILDFTGVNDVDAVAIDTLANLIDTLDQAGIAVHLAGVKGPVRDLLARAKWPERYGERIQHLTVSHALRALPFDLDPPLPNTSTNGT